MSTKLTTGETAGILGVCKTRVIQLEQKGRLTAERIGRGFRLFDIAQVIAFAEERAKKKQSNLSSRKGNEKHG